MKIHVVLVLAVFTAGCKAVVSHPGGQKPKLEVMLDFFGDFYLQNINTASRIYRDFKTTEFGSAVAEHLEEAAYSAAFAAGGIAYSVTQSIPPVTAAIIKASLDVSSKLAHEVREKISDIVQHDIEPRVQEAAPVMEEAIGKLFLYSELVQDLISPYITELKEKVDPTLQEIQARIHALNKPSAKTG